MGVSLLIVLLNPPPRADTVTERNVAAAAAALAAPSASIVNLCQLTTTDLPTLSHQAIGASDWLAARSTIGAALETHARTLFAYGLGGLTGASRLHFQEQLSWLHGVAVASGHSSAFMLGGQPRHPSRWRQYLGPSRALYGQATFEERLRAALIPTPLTEG